MTSDGFIRSFNPAAEHIFGYAADEVIDQPLRILMPERFRGSHEKGFREYLGGREAHVMGKGAVELAGLRKDSAEFPLELSLGEMREEDDILFTGIIRDVTARKQVEETIKGNERRFRQLFNQSVDALLVHDSSGRIVDCNEEACRSLGYTREEMLSFSVKDFATNLVSNEEKWKKDGDTLWERALAGEPGRVAGIHRGRHRRKDGTTFPVEVHVGSVDYNEKRMLFASVRDITERLKSETELREAEARFRSAFEDAAIGMALTDPRSGRYLRVNRALCEMFGYTEGELLATSFQDVTYAEDRDDTADYARRAVRGEITQYQHEKRYVHADGHLVWAQSSVSLVQDSLGRPLYFVAQMQDVTESKEAERKLQEAERQFRSLVEQIPAVTYRQSVGEDGQSGATMYASPQIEAQTGYPPQDFTEDPELWIKILHPEDRELVLEEDERTDETGEPFDAEYRIVTKEGGLTWVRDEAILVRDDEGNALYWQGIQLDITEHKQAEEERREAAEQYRRLVETVQEGIAFIGPENGIIDYCNEAYAEILGLAPRELVGRSFFDFLDEEHKEKVQRQSELRKEGVSSAYEICIIAADGRTKDVSATGSPILNPDGSYSGAVQSIIDVTESRQAQRRLSTQYAITRILEGSDTLEEASPEILKAVCEGLGWEIGELWALDQEEELRCLSNWHAPEVYEPEFFETSRDTTFSRGAGLPGRVWEAGEPIWVSDVVEDGNFPRASVAAREGLHGAFAFPMLLRDEVLGVVEFFTREVRQPDRSVLQMARTIGAQLGQFVERRRAEKELLSSQASLAEAQRMAQLGSWEWDLKTGGISWSDEVFRIYGYEPGEFTPSLDRLMNVVHPGDRDLVSEKMDAALHRGAPYDFTHRIVRPGGEERIIQRQAEIVYDEQDEPLRMVGTIQDITERKRAEEEIRELNDTLERRVEERTEQLETAVGEIRESEERFQSILDNYTAVVYVKDVEGRFLMVNRQFENLFHFTREEIAGKTEYEVFPKEVAETFQANDRRALEAGSPLELEEIAPLEDGLHVYNSIKFPLLDSDGIPYAVCGISIDITERKRAEEALRQSQERYGSLFQSNPDAVYELDGEGRFVSVNQAMQEISGYGIEDLKGTTSGDYIVPEYRESAIQHFAAARSGTSQDYETAITHKDGHRVEIAMTHLPIYVGDKIVGVYGIAKDITQRKQVEKEIRELNENLEARVWKRTTQLQDTVHELEDARLAADAANRAKSEFLANMSHEIRTPMNGVIGMTEILLDTELTYEQRDFAETVKFSGENLMIILNDILDFSKIEAGKMNIETIDFDLRTAIEGVASLLAERAHEKNLEIASLIEYDVPTALRGDPGRIRQVLTNLLGNAIKFTEEGEVVLRVEPGEKANSTTMVRFSVSDTGIGMTPEQKEKVFGSFSQADTSTTRRYGGTGLGLAISKQLVELMGGRIWAESEPGAGSTFFFELPLEKQSESVKGGAAGSRDDLRGLKVLIVDDNSTNRQILREQTASWDMVSGSAERGAEGLSMLRAAAADGEPYDVAILDMQMPEMDGMELARRIRGDSSISSTILILLTSMGRRGDGREAREAGVSAYLTKPAKQSELYDTLAAVTRSAEEESTRLITRHSLREMKAERSARVLLAEDNEVNQKVAVRMLERLGYRVDVAEDGLEALDAMSRHEYVAVLMDVQMPNMNGYETTVEIRRGESERGGRHTPIIAMTANAMQGDREKALEAGMDDYVPKPVKPKQLSEVLGRWISPTEGSEPEAPVAGSGNVQDTSIDYSVIESLRELQQDDEPDLLAELTELFLDDTDNRLVALRAAIETGDAESVERTAHSLKGSSGNMGALKMSEICKELENAGTSEDLSGSSEMLEQLVEEFERVREALGNEVKEQPT